MQVAREYDALVITDDVYDQLQWPASPASTQSSLDHAILPRIVDIDRYQDGGAERSGADGFGNAVSNGSFSKIVAPGCRTGWLEGSAKFAHGLSQVYLFHPVCELCWTRSDADAENSGSSASGGAPSQLVATFINNLIENGDLQHHIKHTLQPSYARRYRSMISAITTHLLPLGVTLPQSNRDVLGGYFIWFSLPEPLRADDVAERAKDDENTIIAQGSLFGVYGDVRQGDLEREVRVCFSWEEEARLVEGIERLARVIRSMQAGETGTARANAGVPPDEVGEFQ